MKIFKSFLLDLFGVITLTLGVSLTSYGIHTSKLQYSFIGGICLGLYELIKDD